MTGSSASPTPSPSPSPASASSASSLQSTLITSLGYLVAASAGAVLSYLYLTRLSPPPSPSSPSLPHSSSPSPPSSNSTSSPSSSPFPPPSTHVSTRTPNDPADPLDPEWFRLHGHALIDWITRYRQSLSSPTHPPVQCQLPPGFLAPSLPSHPPSQPEPFPAILADVERLLVPGLTHWQSPHFYAWFKNHASYPSLLGDMLSGAFSSVGFSWISSPASAELEAVVMDWMAGLFGLPDVFRTASGVGGGSICQTAGEAGIIALLTAKRKAMEGFEEGKADDATREARERRLVLYVGDQAHGILGRAVKVAGIPSSRMRVLKAKREHGWRMDPEEVRAAMQADVDAGLIPFFLWVTSGTTSTAAIDDCPALSAVAHSFNCWIHADGAYGGVYAMLPELAASFDYSSVDSLNINAHKGLFTHFDCAFLWVSDRYFLTNALTLPGMAILRNAYSDAGQVIDYKDWGLSFGRRFRSLKVWCMLRAFGVDKVREMLRWSIDGVREVAKWAVEEDGRFEVVEDVRLGLLCFRVKEGVVGGRKDGNEVNKELMDRCNKSGEIFFSQTMVEGRTVLRLATTGVETREQLRRDWAVIVKHLDQLIADEKSFRAKGS